MKRLSNPRPIEWKRNFGRTEWMLREAVNAVVDGQPFLTVVGTNHAHSEKLMHRFLSLLSKANPLGRRRVDRKRLQVETYGSAINFTHIKSKPPSDQQRVGFFVDHEAHTIMSEIDAPTIREAK